jgi:RND family efflux transporter MFP subunit
MKRALGILVRIVLLVLVLAGLVAAGRALLARKRAALARSPKFELAAAPVDVVEAYTGDLEEGHDYLAVTEPFRTAAISARIVATIKDMHVREGDVVKEGDVLVSLDDRQFQDSLATVAAQIAQAEAELAANQASVASLRESLVYWERQLARDRSLADSGTIPPAQAEATAEKTNGARGGLAAAEQKSGALEQQVKALQRKADEVRTTLTYCRVVSPFAGVVTVKDVDPGDLASPGKTLLVVEDRSSVKLAFEVPQSDLPAFHAGLTASFPIGDETRRTPVSRVYPSLSRARMVRAEVVLPAADAADLPLGAYLDVSVVFRRCNQATLVPVDALIETSQGEPRVFVIENGALRVRPVRVLGMACEMAAVDGVAAGEQVVANSFLGWARLSDGMNVEARR